MITNDLSGTARAGASLLAAKVLPLVVAGLAFVLVLPPAPVSLMLALLICAALPLATKVLALRPWREPAVAIGLALLAWTAIHTLWTNHFDWIGALDELNRYHELLLALLLVPIFRIAGRHPLFLQSLAAGALLWAGLHWLSLAHEPLAQFLAKRRISAGWTLSVTAFLLVVYAPTLARPWLWRLAALALALSVLFVISGRTGHVTLLILFVVAAVLQVRNRRALFATVVVAGALLAAAASSPRLQERIAETLDASASLDQPVTTSSEIRIQLTLTTLHMLKQHGWSGVGHTRFPSLYSESVAARLEGNPNARERSTEEWARSDNPHNEYLLQLVGGGAVALLLFLAWLIAPLFRPAPVHVRHALFGLVLAFGIGSLFNSLLKDFVEGHFLIVTLSWLLAQADQR